jgi:short subunit dehydrogenase-like uncharacterized protein
MSQEQSQEQSQEREFDVIFWGASGFTGQLVLDYLVKQYGVGKTLKWAIAGRNEEKLSRCAKDAAGDLASEITIIIADSNDVASMESLVKRTKVICTTVGPYAMYGSHMVEACVNHGTHCCDLTGEVQWMRKMIDAHQTAAENSGARIVHTCGFDSIPSDLGVYFLQNLMQERHQSAASEVKFRVAKVAGGMSGGTVASMMNMMEEMKVEPELSQVLADPYALNPRNLPQGKDKNDQAGAIYDEDAQQWTAPFVMAAINTRVVRRTNALLNNQYGEDFRYSESMFTGRGPSGFIKASMISMVSGLFMLLAYFAPTRSLLKRVVPAPGEGPSPEDIEKGFFNIELFGRHPEDATKNMRVLVTGDKDPGYGATSKMLVESAVCLAQDDLDVAGGFWTPASAMGSTLIKRLQANAGMTFEIKSSGI